MRNLKTPRDSYERVLLIENHSTGAIKFQKHLLY